jgi:hypothetical protein
VPLESKATLARNGITQVSRQLRVGALDERITVTGERPIIDAQSSKPQNTVSKEVLSAVQRARLFQGADREGYRTEFIQLAGLAAGLADRADAA